LLEIAVINEGWDVSTDWQVLAEKAVNAALDETPYTALRKAVSDIEIAIRLTNDEEVHALNLQYRGKDKPTNVLSFPGFEPDELQALPGRTDPEIMLGDIVLAQGVCAREAADKGIDIMAHAAHLIIHGTLHVLGHDHADDREADAMESLEIAAMHSLGYNNPYEDKH
jgi:probable rRNA maturation factor